MKKILILILFFLTGCANLDPLADFVPGIATATPWPAATATLQPAATATPWPAATATPEPIFKICTGYERGRVNVRACAGTGCPVKGILQEGEPLELSTRESGSWQMINRPLTGWINSAYLCEDVSR